MLCHLSFVVGTVNIKACKNNSQKCKALWNFNDFCNSSLNWEPEKLQEQKGEGRGESRKAVKRREGPQGEWIGTKDILSPFHWLP